MRRINLNKDKSITEILSIYDICSWGKDLQKEGRILVIMAAAVECSQYDWQVPKGDKSIA